MRRIFLQNFTKNLNEYNLSQTHREFHHIKNVLRAKPGDLFEVFNGLGLTGVAEIVKISSNNIKLIIKSSEQKEIRFSKVNIAIPVIKHNPYNFILKSLIQLNINKIFPYISEYSIAKNMPKNKFEKWNNIIIEASKQSGNNYLIPIEKLYDFNEILDMKSDLKICFNNSADKFIKDIQDSVVKAKEILLLIGPEGGFSKFELNLLEENFFTIVKLNSNILRSEVATITALSIIKFLAGEL